MTLNFNDSQYNLYSAIILSNIMPSVAFIYCYAVSVIMLSIKMLNVIMLSVVILSIIMLNVIMLSVLVLVAYLDKNTGQR